MALKLSPADRLAIIAWHEQKKALGSIADIAEKYRVSRATVENVIYGRDYERMRPDVPSRNQIDEAETPFEQHLSFSAGVARSKLKGQIYIDLRRENQRRHDAAQHTRAARTA